MYSGYNTFKRIMALATVFLFSWSFVGICDLVYAFERVPGSPAWNASPEGRSIEEELAEIVEGIKKILEASELDSDQRKTRVRSKRQELKNLDIEIRRELRQTEKRLQEASLPKRILERHYELVEHYEAHLNKLLALLEAIEKEKPPHGKPGIAAEGVSGDAVEKAKAFLDRIKPPEQQTPFDPEELPHRSAQPTDREPTSEPRGSRNGTQRHSAVSERETAPVPSTQAADRPTQEDLSETIEVQLTADIHARAHELGNDPVEIYNWVRNNIHFIPTYGSIQGAQMCLETRQCNAFDTASLLIALLRASNIPARYIHGTIELPIEKLMNWAGGFSNPEAALRFVGTGGTPVRGLVSGGEIVAAQLEHVWVEAYVDYLPSRGARHKKGDSWIPLDASYKQYNHRRGIDFKTAVPFDARSFLDEATSTATIDDEEGYATNLDSLFIQQAAQQYQTRVESYLSKDHPETSIEDILGWSETIQQDFPCFLGTLPYRKTAEGKIYSSLPDNLRLKVTFSIKKDDFAPASMSLTKSLPELAGKKITLSYSPATPEDEALINSYLPEPRADGAPIQLEELPTSLPAYLIHVKPEFRIDGRKLLSGDVVGLGAPQVFRMNFHETNGPQRPIINSINAGVYVGIAINTGNLPTKRLSALKSKLQATRVKLESGEYENLTKDDVVGDLMYATAAMYQAELELFGSLAAKSTGVRAVLLPSEAMFFTQLKVGYFWGIPKSVSFAGMGMDADRVVWAATPLDGDNNKYIQFMLSSGLGSSALEHSVPEQMFSNTDLSAQAVSAVKILQIANDRGIPIFRIDQTNAATILPQLQIDEETKQDIRNAVNARKMVMAPKENIDFHGWTGCGYIILDPNTYAGAYMISGGLNGGILISACGLILILAGLSSAAAFGPALAAILLGLIYIGLGLCLIEEDANPLLVSITIVQSIIGKILTMVSPITDTIITVLLPVFSIFSIYSSDDISNYCEGNNFGH